MKFKIKSISILSIFLIIAIQSIAKEGMYLPMLLQKINASEMQAMGMQITPEEIYSVNQASLKDAIVHFGGGCTAELVSAQGLMLTNHHCGYRSIQRHSTIDHDYLTDGFWAPSLTDELPNPGLTATILQSMEDVSTKVLEGITPEMTESQRKAIISANIARLTLSDDLTKYQKLEIKAFYYGNQYIMMESIVFNDVRLVGTPPSNIGKFGGDTDNWMWPRHTGDFSVFRIYANQNNQPADYSKDNQPYKPKKFLEISLGGYQLNDFTMVFGYPGTTQEYLPAAAIKMITEIVNPFKIELRRQKLDIMSGFMEKDSKIRIQYSAEYAGVANGWKKWIGENKGIKSLSTLQNKRQDEDEFTRWAIANKPEYKELIIKMNKLYDQMTPWNMGMEYFVEAGYYEELIRNTSSYFVLVQQSKAKIKDDALIKTTLENLKNSLNGFYRDYNPEVEKQLLIATVKAYQNFPYDGVPKPAYLKIIERKYNGNVEKWADELFEKSMFTNPERIKSFLENYSVGKYKKIEKDMLYELADSYFSNFYINIQGNLIKYQSELDSLQRIFMKAQLEMDNGRYLFPDANSTLRVSYGKVEAYQPRDGVEYNYFTTLEGIMEKENPEIYDYVVEKKLKQLYLEKDYGRYADRDGKMHTCFIASNHTSGGNSGSPVLNSRGQLIGLNFDRNWEGTMSDLDYDPNQCRNITLDIRYCLFIIEKYANAQRLIEEMVIVD